MNATRTMHGTRIVRSLRKLIGGGVRSEPDREVDLVDPEHLRLVLGSQLFDAEFYAFLHPDVQGFPGGAVAHFVRYGMQEVRESSPWFSASDYLADHPALTDEGTPPFLDAVRRHDAETLQERWPPGDDRSLAYLLVRSGLFEPDWYRARYRDIAAAGIDPFEHFVTRGAGELRSPGPGFDSAFYRETYRDFPATGSSPIESYLRHGRRAGRAPHGPPIYDRWMARFDALEPDDLERIARAAEGRPQVLAGILVVDAATAAAFPAVLESWVDQIGAAWQVRLVRAADLDDAAWAACLGAVGAGAAVRACPASEALADLPSGTVVLLGAGACRLRPHTAFVLADAMRRQGAVAAYADHDGIGSEGTRRGPVFKPAMSPEFMRRVAYAGPLVAALAGPEAAAAVAAAAGGRAPWADLLLAAAAERVARVPLLLYHASVTAASDDAPMEPTPSAGDAHRLALDCPPSLPSVALIVPTRDHGDLVRDCIESVVRASDYPLDRIAFVVVDNGTTDPDTLALFEDYRARPGFTIVPVDEAFNFSRLCNAGAAASRAEVLVFLNNDTTVHRPDWLRHLVAHAVRPETGMVGARLLYPDGTVQHGGVVLGVQGLGAHRRVGQNAEEAASDVTREMTSVTGACLAVRRSVFEALGGFDPVLRVAFNDVDLCARSVEAGYRNIYVGEPLLIHHESKSRGFDLTRAAQHRNAREAVYTRARHAALFRDDPSYSPNLSLTEIGALAFPPRVMRPWRRSPPGHRRILLLSSVHGLGHGVATVVAEQAAGLVARGWEVVVGGPPGIREQPYAGCRRVHLWNAEEAAVFAVEEGLDCVMVHTPPFFTIVRHLGARPLVYATDHGEPTPHLFEDAQAREDVDWEKRFCAPLLRRVFAISESIYRNQYRRDAIVVRNGNAHLACWGPDHARRRGAIRERLGWSGRFVVLNVCRFTAAERRYKGIDRYGAVAADLRYLHPDLADRVEFVLAGRGDADDVAHVRGLGLTVFPDVTDEAMIDLYVAADLYLNLSAWEGYNLGIGQALAMGLDVLASDIDAHREFGVETGDAIPDLCAGVARRAATGDEAGAGRRAVIAPWSVPVTRIAEVLEADLAETAEDWRM